MSFRSRLVSFLAAFILIAGAYSLVRLASMFGFPYRLLRMIHVPVPTRQVPPAPPPVRQAPAPPAIPPAPRWCTVAAAPIDPVPSQSPAWDTAAERATGYLEGSQPAYAPNGREIAFVKNEHIWIMGVDGRGIRPLTTDMNPDPLVSSHDSNPAWSPDGRRIAFVSTGTSKAADIWLVRPDGSELTQLTTDPGLDTEPAWSPDGQQIAFVSGRAGTFDLWIMNADGSSPRRITNHPNYLSHPTFSPDGRQIAFSLTVYSTAGGQCLMVVNADGTDLQQVTPPAFRTANPSWGTRGILFHSGRDPTGRTAAWMIRSDGSDLQAIPKAIGEDATWSPDGTRIVFSDHGTIYEFEVPDGEVRPLARLEGYFVAIDIMPGTFPNVIVKERMTEVIVAILSTPGFAALGFEPVWEINQTSIAFGPTGSARRPLSCAEDEVNQDGVTDLVCRFSTAGFAPRHVEGILRAVDVDGIPLEGWDSVEVRGRP